MFSASKPRKRGYFMNRALIIFTWPFICWLWFNTQKIHQKESDSSSNGEGRSLQVDFGSAECNQVGFYKTDLLHEHNGKLRVYVKTVVYSFICILFSLVVARILDIQRTCHRKTC